MRLVSLIFPLVLLFISFLSVNSLSNEYLFFKVSNYDELLLQMEEKLSALEEEQKELAKDIAFYSVALSIKDKLFDHNLSGFSDSEVMEFALVIAEESFRNNIDADMVLAIIKTESSFNDLAVSHKGAMGLMQLLPATAFYISNKIDNVNLKQKDEIFEVKNNLRLGIAYLAYLVKKTGSMEHAIIAYNFGPTNLKRAINNNSRLPQKYLKTVMRNYKMIASNS